MFAVRFSALLIISMHNRIALIVGASSNLKVVRADTWWVITKMAHFQSARNRAV